MPMSFIQRELARLQEALETEPVGTKVHYGLLAALDALHWTLEPVACPSPTDRILHAEPAVQTSSAGSPITESGTSPPSAIVSAEGYSYAGGDSEAVVDAQLPR
jgi:hypothetical protein